MLDTPQESATPEPIAVEYSFRSKAIGAQPDILRIEVAFKMVGSQQARTGPAVAVECTYAADYSIIRPDFKPSLEHVKAFKDGNAIFNVWPYFRESNQWREIALGRRSSCPPDEPDRISLAPPPS